MVPKTERFELRVDDEILQSIDRWRATMPGMPSRAEAVRRLLQIGLDANRPDRPSFSFGEKVIALMLADLMDHLKVRDGIDTSLLKAALYDGHTWAFDIACPGLTMPEADPSLHPFVFSVLSMWTEIERSVKDLSKAERAKFAKQAQPFGDNPKLPGFDGNHETELFSIAKFTVEHLGRFEWFKKRSMNSHWPMASTYRSMLEKFNEMRKEQHSSRLSLAQLVDLMKLMTTYPSMGQREE